MKTFSGSIDVYLSPYSRLSPADVENATEESLGEFFISKIKCPGYTLVGSAQIEVSLLGTADLIENKRAALEADLKKEIAESYKRQETLREQIQNLLALPSEVAP